MIHGKIWDEQSLFGYFAWPTAARLRDNTIMVVCSGFRMRHVCPFGKVAAFYSDDEGQSWSAPCVLSDSILDDRDAGIAVIGDNVVLTTFTSGTAVQRKYMDMWYRQDKLEKENKFIESYLDLISDMHEDEHLGSFYMLGNGRKFGKRQRMNGNVNAPHGPFVGIDNSFILIGESRSFKDSETAGKICVMRSQSGDNWECVGEIQTPNNGFRFCEGHGAQLQDGSIIAHLRAQKDGKLQIWQSQSTDGGRTFSPLRPIINDGAPPHLLKHSSGALICSYACRTLPKAGPRAAISYDGGESWNNRIVLKDDTFGTDIGYSSSVELSDGKILTVFYYTDRPNQDKTALEYVVWSLEETVKNDE